MSKITCKKCTKSFESLNKDLGIESFICPHCGMDSRKEKHPEGGTGIKAPEPKQPFPEGAVDSKRTAGDSSQSGQQTGVGIQSQRQRCEWESEWKSNAILAYVNTVKQVFFQPGRYFGTILPFQDLFSLAVFIYINNFFIILFSLLLQIAISSVFDPSALSGIPIIICVAVFMPVMTTGLTFVFGAILHLFLSMIGGSNKSYDTTITVYGLGTAANLVGIIPFIGTLAALVYTIIINIYGQAEAHEIPVGKAAWSVILPALVIFCCIATGVVAIISLVGGAGFLQGLKQA